MRMNPAIVLKILRLSKGDLISLIDGKGGFFEAKIIAPNEKKCIVEVITAYQNYGKRNFRVSLLTRVKT